MSQPPESWPVGTEPPWLEQLERLGGVGSWRWSPATGELRWSRHLYEIFGLHPDGPPVAFEDAGRVFSAATWPVLRQAVLDAIAAGGGFEVEVDFLRGDGSSGRAIARGQVMRDAEGRPGQVLGSVQDITQRRQGELALRMSEARLRAIFDSAGDGMLLMDGSLTIVMANPAAARMHGCSVGELVGTALRDWLAAPSWARLKAGLRSREDEAGEAPAAPDGGPRQALSGLRADGQEFPVEVTLRQMCVDGQRFHAASERDITEVVAARQELERSRNDLRKLVSRMLSLEEEVRKRIARDVHDELQQPLAAIRMDALAAAMTAEPLARRELSERIGAMAGKAIVATRRIVNDLRPQILDDLGLSAALRSMVESFASRTGMRCECRVLGDDGAEDRMAAEMADCLYRVAQESLNNVARHANARHVKAVLDVSGRGTVVLRITDDGIGIRPEDVKKPDSFGILGMGERVGWLGGTLRFGPADGGGTVVEVSLSTAV